MKKIIIFLFIGVSALLLLSAEAGRRNRLSILTSADTEEKRINNTVILDAGHGGEDGGAVAPDGTAEKDINLCVSNDTAAYFELFGIPYIPVRTVDRSVCDEGLHTIRERKRSDIMNRYRLINDTPNSVLLSIHQNYFTQPQYYGAQIFYSENDARSKELAEAIRRTVVPALQPENNRVCKPTDDHIYLLYHAKTTSVMVECGFLSNEAELGRLKTEEYRSQLGYYIFRGLLFFLNEQKD